MQDTGSTLATYKRLFIPNPFSSDEENEAKKSAQQQEEDAGNAIKDFMTGVWDSLAGTVMTFDTCSRFGNSICGCQVEICSADTGSGGAGSGSGKDKTKVRAATQRSGKYHWRNRAVNM